MSNGRLPRAAWLSSRRVGGQDIGRQLGLIGPGAWAILALYVVVLLTLAIIFGEPTSSTPAGIVVIFGLVLAAGLITSPSRTPLPMWRTLTVVLVVVFAVATISAHQTFHDHPPGQQAWELGCGNFLLFGLVLRQRVLIAWIGESAMLGTLCVWSFAVTGSPLYGLSFSYGQPVSLLAGTIFAVALHRAAERILDFRAAERQRAADEARATATSAAHEAELKLVRDLAEPTLRQIVEGAKPGRDEVRTIEAALRDLIRGRSLAIEPLASALRLARQRGADIIVLDDLGNYALERDDLQRAADWCAACLEDMESKAVTVRLAGTRDGALLTVVDSSGTLRTTKIGGPSLANLASSDERTC